MASSTRVPATEITGIYGALLKTMSRKMLGQVPEGLGVMWHYPAAAQGHDEVRPQDRVVEPARPEPGVVRDHGRGRRRSAAASASTSTTS